VPTPGVASDDPLPSLLTTSDVLGTGWFAADAANVKSGSTVVVVWIKGARLKYFVYAPGARPVAQGIMTLIAIGCSQK
jgi:hypothetical protein